METLLKYGWKVGRFREMLKNPQRFIAKVSGKHFFGIEFDVTKDLLQVMKEKNINTIVDSNQTNKQAKEEKKKTNYGFSASTPANCSYALLKFSKWRFLFSGIEMQLMERTAQ